MHVDKMSQQMINTIKQSSVDKRLMIAIETVYILVNSPTYCCLQYLITFQQNTQGHAPSWLDQT